MVMRNRMRRTDCVLPDGPLRVGRSLRDFFTFWLCGLVVAAEAVDEAAVALAGTFGRSTVGDRAEEFALFGGFAACFLTVFGFAVEGLGDGRGAALLA
jgi:hypothetical protein